MRTAPAVTVEVTPDPVWRGCLLLLVALATVSLPVWWASQLTDGAGSAVGSQWGAALAGLGWLFAVRSTWRLRCPPCHALRWTGQTWQTLDARRHASPVTLTVAIDTGGWMLMQVREVSATVDDPKGPLARLTQPATSSWMALSEQRLPHAWHALRCAVHGQPTVPELATARGARP